MAEIHGTSSDDFGRLVAALARNLDAGLELGAGIHVDLHGSPVVDIWGGWTDRQRTTQWSDRTLVNVWSSGKMVTALTVLHLVDRGDLDLEAPVCDYWPEFAQNGKEKVLVRHLLSHTSGVSAWAQPFQLEDAYDLDASTARLAGQEMWWEPGSASAYHASVFGHLNAELVRRVTGRTLGRFVRDEIAGPVGADFHFGLADADHERCATIYAPVVEDITASLPPAPSAAQDPDSVFSRTLAGSISQIEPANTAAWRRAEIPGTNGQGNARSLVQILKAVTLGGESNGVKLLSPATIDRIFDVQADGIDMFLNIPLRWGIGFALTPSGGAPFLRGDRVCFWGGWGGSITVMDLDRGLTIGYAMNQMQPGTFGSDVIADYCEIIYDCLDA